jgi:hypothetical protein
MRFLIIAAVSISALAAAPNAFALNPHHRPHLPVVTSSQGGRNPATEPDGYEPCPASVVFRTEHHTCLGMPN